MKKIVYHYNNFANQTLESQKSGKNVQDQITGELQMLVLWLEFSPLFIHHYIITLEFGKSFESEKKRNEYVRRVQVKAKI